MKRVHKLLLGRKTSAVQLTKQFALLSFLCILLTAVVSAFMLSQLFTDKILSRDATVSQEFIDSITATDETWRFFLDTKDQQNLSALEKFFSYVAHMPDVVRANVYDDDKSVLWSSTPELIGEYFKDNEELDRSLRGELTFESGIIGDTDKEEHKDPGGNLEGMHFIETYVPLWNGDRSKVVGSVELYKLPRVLHQSIIEGQRLIWISALLGGLLLFTSLYWIVKRASLVMENQQQRLLETRSLSMIGETSSAIAHAMRNPLASIRACAELTLSDDLEGARESAMDIISETDRLDRWARELLQFSATNTETPEELDINALIKDVLAEHEKTLKRSSTTLQLDLAKNKLFILGHHAPLSQVYGNLIMNAVEAMGKNGILVVKTAADSRDKQAIVTILDNGPGLSEKIKDRLFQPFATTKPTGTGLGLALSRRLVEHYDGILSIDSEAGRGVTATVKLPLASDLS